MAPRVDAITFDFWNTLVVEDHVHLRDRRMTAWLGLLEGAGFALERQHLDAAMAGTWAAFQAAWHAGEQFGAVRTAEHCLSELGIEVPPSLRDELVDALTSSAADVDLRLTDGVADALAALDDAGLRIGIICDVGLTPSPALRGHLERLGVLHRFDHWTFSDEVGAYKPAPVVFSHAAAGLGLRDGDRAAHIGDLRRTDVAGAQAFGWLALRYAGAFDDQTDGPEADVVITDHRDLPAALGV